MNIFRQFVNGMQNTVDTHSNQAHFPLGFDVNITGLLVECIDEEVIDGIDHMLIIGGKLICGLKIDIALEVSQIHAGTGKLGARPRRWNA